MAGLCLIHGYRKGAELGVSIGRFTMFMCATIQDLQMISVDTWCARPDNNTPGQQKYVGWTHEANEERFRVLTKKFFPDRVEIIKGDTADSAVFVKDGSLDFVFVDADHSVAGCARDIDAWLPKIRKGGLIAGHDYDWATVREAVNGKFPRLDFVGADNVWGKFI